MPGQSNQPDLNEWRRLYEATDRFHKARPWGLLADIDVFGVKPYGADEISYCIVMGNAGIEYGLVVYLGQSGVNAHLLAMQEAVDDDESILLQNCLSVSFGPRDLLDPGDRSVISSLGLKFRGRLAWPFFRSFKPIRVAAHLQASEATLLATCLDQASEMVQAVRDGKIHRRRPDGGTIPLRQQDATGNWEPRSMPFPSLHLPIEDVPAERLAGPMDQLPVYAQDWEVRLLALAPIEDHEGGGFWGRMLMCVDHESGFVLGASILDREDSVSEALLDSIERAEYVPSSVRLTSRWLQAQLKPVTEALRIKVRRVKRLRMLEEASAALYLHFGR